MLTYFWTVFLQMLAQCVLAIALAIVGSATFFLGHAAWKRIGSSYSQAKIKKQGYVNV